jgi:hypothetical protein
VATTTTKLALTKPDGTDLVDIAVLNANADKIDTASGAFVCTSTTRPASPWNGQLIFETDTLNALVYRTSSTSWNIVGGSTVSENPPANAGNGNFWWDSDNGKLYIFYNDGNTSQWVSANSNTSGVPIVGNEAGRNSLYPTPAQGNSVFRNDLGTTETYYGLHNASTNPGGRAVAGWYNNQRNIGLVPIVPPTVSVSGGTATANTLGVVSFTGATSIILNGVFSSQFVNYKMVINVTTGPAVDNQALRMRLPGAGSTSYFHSGVRQFGTSIDTAASLGASVAQFFLGVAGRDAAGSSSDVTIFAPFVNQNTKYSCQNGGNSTASEQQSHTLRGRLNDTASYTAVEIYPSAGNISGTIQVYGYND